MNLFRLGDEFFNLDALVSFEYLRDEREVELEPTRGGEWGKAVRIKTRQATLKFLDGRTLELRGRDADRFEALVRESMREAG